MWLTGRLVPDHKTIADFRKDNGPGIRKACARFVELCRQIGVLSGGSVATDGSKFKAVNNRDRNFTSGKIELRISHREGSASRYLDEMGRADALEQSEATLRKVTHLKEKLARVRGEVRRLEGIAVALKDVPDGQISLTDPGARSMATYGKGTGLVGYNVQTAVDVDTHLVVTHEVTNIGSDRSQLALIAKVVYEGTGKPYWDNCYWRMFSKAREAGGVPKHIWSMGSRAGAITETVEATGSLEKAPALAAHSSPKMTRKYARGLLLRRNREAAEARIENRE